MSGVIPGRNRPPLSSARWRKSTLTLALVLALVGLLVCSPAAFAHAQLLGTSPASGSTLATQPKEVIFEFNQNVGGTLGAVRVYNAQGDEVDNLEVSHPKGNEHWMGVGLKPGLPDGTYTGTYRVVSADTHIVYGGLVFNIGHAGAAPKFTVAGLIGRNKSGRVTEVAFGVVRGLDYLTIALLLGGLAFVLVAWLPGFAAVVGPQEEWEEASRMFASRMRLLLIVAVGLGVIVSVLGVLLQGASAAGVSLWASLKGTIVENTLESRFGKVWGLRALDWVALGVLLAVAVALGRGASRGAAPDAARSGDETGAGARAVAIPSRTLLVLIALCAVYLAITPALSGHPSIQSPTGVFFPSDVLHVLAASVWPAGCKAPSAPPHSAASCASGSRSVSSTTRRARRSSTPIRRSRQRSPICSPRSWRPARPMECLARSRTGGSRSARGAGRGRASCAGAC